jgi:hypothetical protein
MDLIQSVGATALAAVLLTLLIEWYDPGLLGPSGVFLPLLGRALSVLGLWGPDNEDSGDSYDFAALLRSRSLAGDRFSLPDKPTGIDTTLDDLFTSDDVADAAAEMHELAIEAREHAVAVSARVRRQQELIQERTRLVSEFQQKQRSLQQARLGLFNSADMFLRPLSSIPPSTSTAVAGARAGAGTGADAADADDGPMSLSFSPSLIAAYATAPPNLNLGRRRGSLCGGPGLGGGDATPSALSANDVEPGTGRSRKAELPTIAALDIHSFLAAAEAAEAADAQNYGQEADADALACLPDPAAFASGRGAAPRTSLGGAPLMQQQHLLHLVESRARASAAAALVGVFTPAHAPADGYAARSRAGSLVQPAGSSLAVRDLPPAGTVVDAIGLLAPRRSLSGASLPGSLPYRSAPSPSLSSSSSSVSSESLPSATASASSSPLAGDAAPSGLQSGASSVSAPGSSATAAASPASSTAGGSALNTPVGGGGGGARAALLDTPIFGCRIDPRAQLTAVPEAAEELAYVAPVAALAAGE